jgi:hypothetical protein
MARQRAGGGRVGLRNISRHAALIKDSTVWRNAQQAIRVCDCRNILPNMNAALATVALQCRHSGDGNDS